MSDEIKRAVERLTADSWDVYGIRPQRDDDEWAALADKLTADGRALAQQLLDIGKLCDDACNLKKGDDVQKWGKPAMVSVADVRKILEGT